MQLTGRRVEVEGFLDDLAPRSDQLFLAGDLGFDAALYETE